MNNDELKGVKTKKAQKCTHFSHFPARCSFLLCGFNYRKTESHKISAAFKLVYG